MSRSVEPIDRRISASLGLFNAASSAFIEADGALLCQASIRASAGSNRSWRPARNARGTWVLFDGAIDNRESIAQDLGLAIPTDAQLYASAIERWGDTADNRLHGLFSAIAYDPQSGEIRVARSPLRAPPLHYWQREDRIVIASVPRALFATGELAPEVDETKLVDNLFWNASDEERGWYRGTRRIPLGSIVHFHHGTRKTIRYYDPHAAPKVRLRSDAEYVEAARELLREGTRAALYQARDPGMCLSGGLDSPQVAMRTLELLPAERDLPSYTFVPSAQWDGHAGSGMFGDDRPFVEALAERHPRIKPTFIANEGIDHDHRWKEMFLASGTAPAGMPNFYLFHELWAQAKRDGRDTLLFAEFGNATFSASGVWGLVEYLKTGRLRQLWRGLKQNHDDPRSMPRRFMALSVLGLLPPRAWAWLKQQTPGYAHLSDSYSPLRPQIARDGGLLARAREAGVARDRAQFRNRREWIADGYANADMDSAEIYQGFEQIYGIRHRDPTYYRPLVEFCYGLPTDQFMRDGETRWLARRMGAGEIPEAQLANRDYGEFDVDWHHRLARRQSDYTAALSAIAADPQMNRLIDVPRLQAALTAFPDTSNITKAQAMTLRMAVRNALMTAQFADFVSGRNPQ